MKKKLLSSLLALTLVLTILTGCIPGAAKPGEPDATMPSSGETVQQTTDGPADISTEVPTDGPSEAPTESPTEAPTDSPTEAPTDSPTEAPADDSTGAPTDDPTGAPTDPTVTPSEPENSGGLTDLSTVPAFSGAPYITINGGKPYFKDSEIIAESFETYAPLDNLGRCGVTFASLGKDLMPDGNRGEIGQVKPTGWHTVKYDCVEGKYLYNRCHLIGWQLSGENANTCNLITGTRFLNIKGMLPFENMVADYIKETNNHVMYRVTPVFRGSNLVADGVLMEGWSVEDNGEGICFCVFAYNAQPGVIIDYATGSSHPENPPGPTDPPATDPAGDAHDYVANKNSHIFHRPDCPSVNKMREDNKEFHHCTRQEMLDNGYKPCKNCEP